ncbi:DUF4386 domain-containing protein [Salinimicrobium oceani]|uniref:DUF4386 domain-containing protein n=1 Tax=Salinimicrobium oceani TaxID=2722702 RepID=A0ABX1D0L5_9FLAO|nr:DUF4386 domain-containing protein [Salinimicrobium oceani]NJW54057.1 DUF4386 domain-containing protein [Salinimicrobium oceani]
MKPRTLAILAGFSYLVIFFAAIFANFMVLEAILENPLETVQQERFLVGLGIFAFMLTVIFDAVVAWALYELYREHKLSGLSTIFRLIHATVMGVAIAMLPLALDLTSNQEILQQVEIFNTIWLLGLFFFGVHLILLAKILDKPQIIRILLLLAGIMYMVDTTAHFMLPNYEDYASVFLMLVAVPSILGEMSFAIWLLVKGGKDLH